MKQLLSSLLALGAIAYAQTPAVSTLLANGNVEPSATATVGNTTKPRPDVPPIPRGNATVMGGMIQTVDHVRDRLVLQVFGGVRVAVLFDERTRVYRGQQATTLDALQKGERVYVDTMLDGKDVFARSVRVSGQTPAGAGSGQVVDFDAASGALTLRDTISPTPVKLQLSRDAVIMNGDRQAQRSDLQSGALVTLDFVSQPKGPALVRKVSILAAPGTLFAFSGRVQYLDVHRGLLVLVDPRDNKSYDVEFDPATGIVARDIREGSDVTVSASFDGRRYAARKITRNATANP